MTTSLPALLVAPLLTASVATASDFDLPEPITAAGETFEKIIYPTPVLHDVDGDERRELIVGDLMGNVWVHEADGAASGTTWTKAENLKTYIAIQGVCDTQSRDWIQYQYTKKGLNIGSFTLSHIR